MANQNEFYIILPSNSGHSSNDKTGNFSVYLPKNIQLDGEWEVALTEIIFPYTWVNLPDRVETDGAHTTTVFVQFRNGNVLYFDVSKGQYDTVSQLLKTLNQTLNHNIGSFKKHSLFQENKSTDLARKISEDKLSNILKFKIDEVSKQVYVAFQTSAIKTVALSKHLSYMLGFESGYISAKNVHEKTWYEEKAKYAPDLHVVGDALYVYCNLVQPQLVGDTCAPLLRIVHVNGTYGNTIEKTFFNRNYLPLIVKNFTRIHIDIKSSDNRYIEFDSGKTIVTLHFRRKRLLFE